MSKEHSESGPDWEISSSGLVVPDVLPAELIAADLVDRRADRGVAFAHIDHSVESMGIGIGDARYFAYPLGSSVERRVIVARVLGRFGEEVRVFLNDEFPHPAPSLLDVRRKRMITYAASTVGKRAVSVTSTMDKIMADALWYSDGPYVGPHIVPDDTLGLVEVRGKPGHVLVELPHPDTDICEPGAPDRTDAVLRLGRLLDCIPALHVVENMTVIMPTAETLTAKLKE